MPIIIVEIDSIAQSDLADMMDEYSDGVYPWSKNVNQFRISWLKYIDGELDKVGRLTPETEIEYMAIDQINTHVGEIYLDQIT